MLEQFRRLVSAEDGATAVEYALIAVGLAVAISATVVALGTTLSDDLFTPILSGF